MVMILRDFLMWSGSNWMKAANAAAAWRSYLKFNHVIRAMVPRKAFPVDKSQPISNSNADTKMKYREQEDEDEEDMDVLLKAFHTMDGNGDGVVTMEELNVHLAKIGVPLDSQESAHMAASLSPLACGMGFEEFREFYRECVDIEHDVDDDDFATLKEAFNVFDVDRDGFISVVELRHVVPLLTGNDCPMDWESALAQFDTNSDGFIDFSEFCTMMHARELPHQINP